MAYEGSACPTLQLIYKENRTDVFQNRTETEPNPQFFWKPNWNRTWKIHSTRPYCFHSAVVPQSMDVVWNCEWLSLSNLADVQEASLQQRQLQRCNRQILAGINTLPCWRVMETGHPSTRAVDSGSGNRALVNMLHSGLILRSAVRALFSSSTKQICHNDELWWIFIL